MIISHSHKFIFIHVHKNAGSAIGLCLSPYYSHAVSDLPFHITARDLKREIESGCSIYPILNHSNTAFEEYFKFAVVRNPWDWIVSLFFWLRGNKDHDFNSFVNSISFSEFVEWLHNDHSKNPEGLCHGSHYAYRQTQLSFVSIDGRVALNKILRFENIESDFSDTCDILGIDAELTKTNDSIHGPYRDYYDEESKNKIQELFAEDIKVFEYEF